MSPESQNAWTLRDLEGELQRFERELEFAGLRPNTVRTYVDRSAIFLRFLGGDYIPQGPRSPGEGRREVRRVVRGRPG